MQAADASRSRLVTFLGVVQLVQGIAGLGTASSLGCIVGGLLLLIGALDFRPGDGRVFPSDARRSADILACGLFLLWIAGLCVLSWLHIRAARHILRRDVRWRSHGKWLTLAIWTVTLVLTAMLFAFIGAATDLDRLISVGGALLAVAWLLGWSALVYYLLSRPSRAAEFGP